MAVVAITALLTFVPMQYRAGGTFTVRSRALQEIRAPMAGFLREVGGDEGDKIANGDLVARLEVPDLDSRIAQKCAESLNPKRGSACSSWARAKCKSHPGRAQPKFKRAWQKRTQRTRA